MSSSLLCGISLSNGLCRAVWSFAGCFAPCCWPFRTLCSVGRCNPKSQNGFIAMLEFSILAALILVSAVLAMSLRNLVHCALCLVVTFAGLAALFLTLNAQFVGFAQILVYI